MGWGSWRRPGGHAQWTDKCRPVRAVQCGYLSPLMPTSVLPLLLLGGSLCRLVGCRGGGWGAEIWLMFREAHSNPSPFVHNPVVTSMHLEKELNLTLMGSPGLQSETQTKLCGFLVFHRKKSEFIISSTKTQKARETTQISGGLSI